MLSTSSLNTSSLHTSSFKMNTFKMNTYLLPDEFFETITSIWFFLLFRLSIRCDVLEYVKSRQIVKDIENLMHKQRTSSFVVLLRLKYDFRAHLYRVESIDHWFYVARCIRTNVTTIESLWLWHFEKSFRLVSVIWLELI
jgi:hypothetical protein